MITTRRATIAGLAALTVTPSARAAEVPNPQLRLAERREAKVYLMGFAQAKDRGWLTPKIARAADESAALWNEVAPFPANAAPSSVIAERGYDRDHDLFQVLPPPLSERLLGLAPRIGLTRERLSPMRPWLARQAVQRAFAAPSQAAAPVGAASPGEYPEQVMIARFRARGAPIHSELPTLDALLRHFADYPLQAQVEDLQNLLDYIDDDRKGANEDGYGWIYGKPTDRFIDRMRLETPALYAASHTERNRWWARQIDTLLDQGGVSFVLVGQNHVLGPESIPVNLQRRGIATRLV